MSKNKKYQPSSEILKQAYVKDYERLYKESIQDPEKFWGKIAQELEWFRPWKKVLKWEPPFAQWFIKGKCNIVHNALDRHLQAGLGNKLALIWEGQDGQERKFTYQELNDEVCKLANGLKKLGVKKGDRVNIYLPRLPEQIISMLACAKIGAIHIVVYCGFSVEALKTRILDAKAKVVITADGYHYRDKLIETKKIVDQAVEKLTIVKHIIVVKRTGNKVNLKAKRDVYYDELIKGVSNQCQTEEMDSEDPLYILYTSGTTGMPKGVLHVHGGYMVGIYITLKWIFNIQKDDIWWCTADPGWVTGHSYITYAPFICGLTQFFYEGPPLYPDPGKWWSLIAKYKITKFYTTPTAIRASMRFGDDWPKKYNLDSLRILGTVGEPINPEAWRWYHQQIGQGRCPIMDTWWQTETGMHMISPLPSMSLKPGSATKPFFGVVAEIMDKDGKVLEPDQGGFLVIKKPWPAMFRTLYKNKKRYKKVYWQEIPGVYFTGDAAKKDRDGYFWIEGRTDDVLKVSGYRFGTAELESAFVSHPAVVEAAVIGRPHKIKGQAIKAFVILKQGFKASPKLENELKDHIKKEIGPIAKPEEVEFVDSLPKTRSGKIMRRVLKAKDLGKPVGDTSTLED
ncbi:acetate--CoA ligase [Patescibacteria group bacterium]|nr:acetate--CoA ligase [Patescibacteria group bacterium]